MASCHLQELIRGKPQHVLWDNEKEKSWFCHVGRSWSKNVLKYLGIYLGDEATNPRNWKNICDIVDGRLDR